MPNPYPVLYGIGYTPWVGMTPSDRLTAVLESRAPGRALDLGCGTGENAVLMASRGWAVTGIDAVPKALRAARSRADEAGIDPGRLSWLTGDVTRLADVVPPQTFDLVLDSGCYHGLTERQRVACIRGLDAYSGPGSQLLMLAVVRRRGIGPAGLEPDELRRHAEPVWTLDDVVDVPPLNPKSPLGRAPFRWYLLHR